MGVVMEKHPEADEGLVADYELFNRIAHFLETPRAVHVARNRHDAIYAGGLLKQRRFGEENRLVKLGPEIQETLRQCLRKAFPGEKVETPYQIAEGVKKVIKGLNTLPSISSKQRARVQRFCEALASSLHDEVYGEEVEETLAAN